MTVRVTVAPGRVVRDPRGMKCPQTAFSVDEKDFFWARCLRSGDLVPVTSQAAPVAPAVAPAAEKKADNK